MFSLVLKQERRHRKRFASARDLPRRCLASFEFYEPFSERGIYLALRPVRKKPECEAIQSAPRVVFSQREFFPFHDGHFTANCVKFPVVLRGSSRRAKSRKFLCIHGREDFFVSMEFSANYIFAILPCSSALFFFIDIVIKSRFATRQKFESE